MKKKTAYLMNNGGFTVAEMLVTTLILAIVLGAVNTVFFSSNEMYDKTSQRAHVQMDARLGMSILTKELRHAGCDPVEIGVVGVAYAATDTVRIVGDHDGDGTISIAEPSEDVTYFYDPSSETLFRDPGTGPQVIVPNVTNMTITYLDRSNTALTPLPLSAANAARVRSVAISVTTEARDSGEVTLTTTVALRNM
jgi:prepilin-type N-terminal cleavage/methylation domain-containing protein